MRILVFAHRSNFSGGANRSLLNVVTLLKEKGHDITVIVPRKEGELNDALKNNGINYKYYYYCRNGMKKPVKKVLFPITYLFLYLKILYQIIAAFVLKNKMGSNFDVVYMNTILPYIAIYYSKFTGIPLVIHDRESLDGCVSIKEKNYERFLYNNSDRVIVISRDLKNQWKSRNLFQKIVMINNGIPVTFNEKVTQDVVDDFNLLMTARIMKSKRQMDALMALNILIKEKKIFNIHLFFAGDEGENNSFGYRDVLNKYICQNELGKYVTFLGNVDEMDELRKKMHVELMCNPDEPFGRVTVEGMRKGLVVIAVASGGSLDIISDMQNGLFYSKGNIRELAEKIEYLYANEDVRRDLSEKSYIYGNNHFTMEENVEKIERVLVEVCEERKK